MKTNTNGSFNMRFQQVISYFLDFAYENATNIENGKIRCPCSKCKICYYKTRVEVQIHLFTNGFMKDFQLWHAHGERYPDEAMDIEECSNPVLSQHVGEDAMKILEKRKGGPVGYEFVFVDTHATKETKKRLRDGEININDLEQLEFVTTRSKESFTLFHKELVKEYGPENDQNPDRDEFAVWERLHFKTCGRMFGIGSSDPRFVVSGSQSSLCGSISHGDSRQSQEVKDVKAKLEQETEARQNMENRLAEMAREAEIELAERERLQRQMERNLEKERAEHEKERAERMKLQKIMKKFADK
ncbi:uncharacterized protein LOC143601342 [Bidens hawaiensis]|uniref:uncharacterized protein LOC143601342 n=1 Tax=Bidens hawaiensis TaxID=980011 RepID=UPI00404ADC8D